MNILLNKFKLILHVLVVCLVSNLSAQTFGCTDNNANNFNPNATINDGSCTYNAASVSSLNSWFLPEILNETSGIIWWNNKIWTHNDDTDLNIYSLDTSDINNYSKYPLSSCVNIDWEEISQDSTYIYMGDFGNNVNGNRTNLKILRIDKVSLLKNDPKVDTINFSYSTQTDFTSTGSNNTDFDCEAFVVSKDSIYLFTKEWVSNKSTIYKLPKTPGTYSAEFISSYNVQGLITGASYLEKKNLVTLSGYSPLLQPFVVLLYDFHEHDFFNGNKRKISINLPVTQVEGIATEDGQNYFISNERFTKSIVTTPAKINRIDLSDYLGDYLTSTTINSSQFEKLDIYPNPVVDFLNIKMNFSNLSNTKMTIFNMLGQIIDSFEISTQDSKINVTYYPKGLYCCVITNKGKYLMSKIFIKE